MTRQDVASIALRLLGVYCILQAIPYCEYTPDFAPPLPSLATAAALGCTAAVLFFFARPLGQRMAGSQTDPVLSQRWTARHLQAIAFCVAGAYLIAVSLPEVFVWVGRTLYVSAKPFLRSENRLLPWHMMLNEMSSAALGLWLFLGSAGWIGVWHRVRKAGSPSA